MKSNWLSLIIFLASILNPIKAADKLTSKNEFEVVSELRREEPYAQKFASFAYLLPEDVRDSFDFDVVIPQPLKNVVMNDVFIVHDKISIISPRFIGKIGSNGDIKQLIPHLKTWIDDYKKIYFEHIKQGSNKVEFGDSFLSYLAMIIWYYTWFLRLLEHPEKPLFVSDMSTPEGAEVEAHGLWDIVGQLVFETDPKTGGARSHKMNNVESALHELLMSRLRAVNATIAAHEATKHANDKKESEFDLEPATYIPEVNQSQDALLQQ